MEMGFLSGPLNHTKVPLSSRPPVRQAVKMKFITLFRMFISAGLSPGLPLYIVQNPDREQKHRPDFSVCYRTCAGFHFVTMNVVEISFKTLCFETICSQQQQ